MYLLSNRSKNAKSYLSKEPAAARALANNFDPYLQIISRLSALEMNGHPINKLEIIVIGGTFDYYEKEYQESFIKEILELQMSTRKKKIYLKIKILQNYKKKMKHQNVELSVFL